MSEMEMLITVVVISYNSGNTIAETLHSILEQTYDKKNIEVIISDDGSQDDTLLVAQEWKKQNQAFFKEIIIISHKKNKGVAANCNQGWRLASGKWIKTIAADDLLLPDCLKHNACFVSNNPGAKIVFSDMIPFTGNVYQAPIVHDKNKILCNQQQQFNNILSECYLLAPTAFINNEVLKEVGYADESYPMIEDYPLWFKCLSNGYLLSYLEETTVLYRKGDSLSQQGTRIGNASYLESFYNFQKEKIWPKLPLSKILKKWDDYLLFKQRILWIRLFGNKVTLPYLILQKSLFLIRPYRLYSFAKKLMNK